MIKLGYLYLAVTYHWTAIIFLALLSTCTFLSAVHILEVVDRRIKQHSRGFTDSVDYTKLKIQWEFSIIHPIFHEDFGNLVLFIDCIELLFEFDELFKVIHLGNWENVTDLVRVVDTVLFNNNVTDVFANFHPIVKFLNL